MDLSGTLLSSVLLLPYFMGKKKEKKGDKHRNPPQNKEEPGNP